MSKQKCEDSVKTTVRGEYPLGLRDLHTRHEDRCVSKNCDRPRVGMVEATPGPPRRKFVATIVLNSVFCGLEESLYDRRLENRPDIRRENSRSTHRIRSVSEGNFAKFH